MPPPPVVAPAAAAGGGGSLAGYGAALGGAGSLLSGIGAVAGLGDGASFSSSNFKEWSKEQLNHERRRIAKLVQGAHEAGIHPLFAMGIPPGSGFTGQFSGSSSGDAIANLGVGLRGAGTAAHRYAEHKRLKAQGEAAIEESRARAVQARAAAAKDLALAQESNSRIKRAQVESNATGVGRGAVPLPIEKPRTPGVAGKSYRTLAGPFNIEWPVAPGHGAETIEGLSGDLMQELYGALREAEAWLWKLGLYDRYRKRKPKQVYPEMPVGP